jgi:DNA-binding NarL/FixJ family response regulator
MQPINIIIVDDHEMVREGIKFILDLTEGINIIDEFSDGAYLNDNSELLEKTHVILMDINMPIRDGIETTIWLKKKFPDIHVIALTLEQDSSSITKIMNAGASGYVLKNTRKEAFIDAIHMVMNGQKYFSNEIAQVMLKEQYSSQESIKISDRELEVLYLISEGNTNNEIAEKLFISPRTVDTHRKHLIEKFNARNTANLIKIAAQNGIFKRE